MKIGRLLSRGITYGDEPKWATKRSDPHHFDQSAGSILTAITVEPS
jgi:hypothetical protein